MKKIILIVVVLLSVYNVNAQLVGVKYGIKGGMNVANVSPELIENTNPKLGLVIGALVEISVLEKFAIQPEILFSSQGYSFRYEADFSGSSSDAENYTKSVTNYNYNYINLPVMAKLYATKGLSLQVGPQVGFLISAAKVAKEEVFRDGVSTEKDEVKTTIDEGLNSLDLGVNFGLGYELGLGLFFDLRYNLGLSSVDDVSDIDENISVDDFKTTNQVLQFSVGFKF